MLSLYLSIEGLIDVIPENLLLYRDSGLWQLRSDDMEEVLFQQDSNMSFRDFLVGSIQVVGTRWVT